MLNRWQSTIVDERGNVQPLANLTVRNEADQSLAKMWASPGTTQPLPDGMLQADGNGYAYFYAEGGLYRIQSVALGIDWRHVPLGELASMDVADLGLGTAATRDVGTGANEVPANSNLGAAAYLPIATTSQAQALESDVVVITPQKLADAFGGANQGLAASGYQKLPGGLIIQWSRDIASGGTVTWPIAFPNDVLVAVISDTAIATPIYNHGWDQVASTRTQGRFLSSYTPNSAAYIAIGY